MSDGGSLAGMPSRAAKKDFNYDSRLRSIHQEAERISPFIQRRRQEFFIRLLR
jgi:hypothetical protein